MRAARPAPAARALRRFAAGCLLALAAATAGARDFTFAALGDAPYTPDEESRFVAMIGEMNREPLAFAVHVGDFKSSWSACDDETFLQRRGWFELSHHPFVFVPGDNDWTDCWRAAGAERDPLERLQRLRALFFDAPQTLGQRRFALERQGGAHPYPEHARWVHEGVLFATLNVPGGDDNRGRMPEEAERRGRAVHAWTMEAFRIARERALPGVVLLMQTNPWARSGAPRRSYAALLALFAAQARAYDGEVLIVHGDTHRHRVDQPLVDPETRQPLRNVTRVEVFGSPAVNWVRVRVAHAEGRVRFDATPGDRLLAGLR